MRAHLTSLFLLASIVLCGPAWSEAKYSFESARDPFFEEVEESAATILTESPAESWVLGGILWSPTGGQARINGQSVKAGDRMGDVEVLSIEKKGVKLKRNGKIGILTKQGIQWT